ncbi:hypothetical protein F5148DRAFT_1146752 [Russula earlei]|uniref:Uncharacterized protein n=1 Tax=Russula earlei TaxID=71964 RepID=A0ACC0UIX6_9AGAM|nr:hypothetical protein F5148DRAFT_1146752 [Russula earlei]
MAMTTTATMEWHKHHEFSRMHSFSHVDQVCEPADRETHMTCTRPHLSRVPRPRVLLHSPPSLPHSPFDVIPSRSPLCARELRQRLKTIAVDVTRLVYAPATRIRTHADDARADVIATRSGGSLPIASRPFVIAAPPRALDLQSEE